MNDMLYDTSVKNKEVTRLINHQVGKPFNLLEILKVGAIGSSRLEIVEYSPLFKEVMSWDKQAIFANIEMRPKGIVVIINVRLSNFSWIIPYTHLSVFKSNLLSIHSQGEFLKFKTVSDLNKKLIAKILERKAQFLNMDYYGNSIRKG